MSVTVPPPQSTRPGARRSVETIVRQLALGGPAVVALSGGVDSAVVAAMAARALASDAHAVTLVGPAVAPDEVDRARAVAARVGIDHVEQPIDPLNDAAYRANPSNRCYFCRVGEAGAIRAWGHAHGIVQYLDGVHLDDLGDDRPGRRAMDEAGFRHPLAEAGWRKTDVRAFARSIALPNWDQPSDACLASRVQHGIAIDRPLLERVAQGESWLHDRGFRRVRVRTDGAAARIEVDAHDVARLRGEPMASAVAEALRGLGFVRVEIDPVGYRARPGM